MAEEYGLGSVHCPWIIQVSEGQRINLTLLNFMHNAAGKVQMFFSQYTEKNGFQYFYQLNVQYIQNKYLFQHGNLRKPSFDVVVFSLIVRPPNRGVTLKIGTYKFFL